MRLSSRLSLLGVLAVVLMPAAASATTTVKLQTSVGDLTLDLDEAAKPVTVANFLRYIRDGYYANTFVHRLPQGFVLQGGAFAINNNQTVNVSTFDPIMNEAGPFPAYSNVKGTIAMALSGTGNNTATGSWFINLKDNNGTDLDNLDTLNGGFTVFGHVVSDPNNLIQRFANFKNYTGADGTDLIANAGTGLESLPLQAITGGQLLISNLIFTTWSIVGGTQPVIASPSTVYSQQGTAFSYQITATGAPTSFAVTSGTLPTGVTIDSTSGLISGTPTDTTPATLAYTISATGTSGTGSASLSIGYNYPVIADGLSATATQGKPFRFQIAATNNPTSYGADNLPDGVTVNPVTGLISGVSTVYGSGFATIYAANAGGTYSAQLHLTIAQALPPAPILDMKKKFTGNNGGVTLKGTASAGTVKIEVKPGKGGFKRAKGTIQWSYKAKGLKPGSYKFKVRATDSDGHSSISTVKVLIKAGAAAKGQPFI